MISTDKRISYATGYISLRMYAEAAEELTAVAEQDRFTPAVLGAWSILHLETGQLDAAERLSLAVLEVEPANAGAWIALGRIISCREGPAAATEVLRQAEFACGEWPMLDYDLARYLCLMGHLEDARARLTRACNADPRLRDGALSEPDLAPVKDATVGAEHTETEGESGQNKAPAE